MGYQKNKYDWYGTKKVVKVKQCTIIWNIEDPKMLHVDSKIVSSVLDEMDPTTNTSG